MIVQSVQIDCGTIRGFNSFHDEFAMKFGFPSFYGRNMNAWTDCMRYLDDPEAGMSSVHRPKGERMVLELRGYQALQKRCPDVCLALEECLDRINSESPAILVRVA